MAPEVFTASTYQRLVGDGLVQALTARFGDRPAIFTSSPIPGRSGNVYPRILTVGETGPVTVGELTLSRQTRDLTVYQDQNGSAALLELLAGRVAKLFSWAALDVEGFENWLASASPPVRPQQLARIDTRVQSRLVRITFFRSDADSAGIASLGFVDYEVPAEVPNGAITNFSTALEFINGSVMVWVNSVPQRPGTDFTEDADNRGFTFTSGAPATSSDLWCSYRYSSSVGVLGFVEYEVPTEVPNGVLTSFSTTRQFTAGSLGVWVNSVRQRPSVDYLEDSDRHGYRFLTGAPLVASDLWHSHRY